MTNNFEVTVMWYCGTVVQAMVHTFIEWCEAHGINLSPEKNFTLSYDTTIPRQAGLSGSSAICCAALNCLLRHYNVHDDVCPIQQRPNIVLEAEKKLGITAGLQDRVIQAGHACSPIMIPLHLSGRIAY